MDGESFFIKHLIGRVTYPKKIEEMHLDQGAIK